MTNRTGSYFLGATTRALAIRLFSLLARVPGGLGLLPTSRLRRQAMVAILPDMKYDGLFPQGAYAPWLTDEPFQRIHRQIAGTTLVDIYRCYELWDLVGQTAHLPGGDILEVGVWRGGTGVLMAARSKQDGGGTVFLADTFAGVVKAGERDSAYVGGEHADTSAAMVSALARRAGVDNFHILEGIFPDATAAAIEDRRFRLCHIDVDVYESAAQTFNWVWPRLLPGGVVVFDDYGFYSCGGVTRLVNGMRGEKDRLVIYNLNAHAVVIKLATGEG